MLKTALLKKRYPSWISVLEEIYKNGDGAAQRPPRIRIIYRMPLYSQVELPLESLAFKEHDAFRTYEAIFLAARDYTNSRIQETLNTSRSISRAYAALYLICWLLSTDQVDDGHTLALRRKIIKHAKATFYSDLTHVLPYMFTQLEVVLLANVSNNLADTPSASLKHANAAASKIPGWPSRHPVRRILSNFVVLSRSENPHIVSQVAENARQCVLDTCSDNGLCSTGYSDQLRRRCFSEGTECFQKIPSSFPLEQMHQAHSVKQGRQGKSRRNPDQQRGVSELEQTEMDARSDSKDDLQRDGIPQELTRQLTEDLDQDSTPNDGHEIQCAGIHEGHQLNDAASHMNVAAVGNVTEEVSAISVTDLLPRDGPALGTLPVQQVEHVAFERLKDGPRQSSAENMAPLLKEKDGETSTLDRIRLYIERLVGEELDWHPLPSIKRPLGLNQSRMSWTVSIHVPNHHGRQR